MSDFKRLAIPDVICFTPKRHSDERGFFMETWNRKLFAENGIDVELVQDNHSLSRQPGVLRGLHFQTPPHAQAKLVRVLKGSIFDVAVDIRTGSPTFGKWVTETLTADNAKQLYVPIGFAHGFLTLEPDTEVAYKVTAFYAPECDRGIAWDDPDINIDWPDVSGGIILSNKDRKHGPLKHMDPVFTIGN